MIKGLINSKLDIFLISDTKIDQIFPNQQFSIEGHEISLYHWYRNSFSGGLLFYANENIPSIELAAEQIDSKF